MEAWPHGLLGLALWTRLILECECPASTLERQGIRKIDQMESPYEARTQATFAPSRLG